ncbi:hypothetical protein AC49_1599 [Escherichia coli 2-460-02_S3_C3]|nr:hypothetical protein AC49_1599 [Escherichia coli 2-460-02_S3_C3]
MRYAYQAYVILAIYLIYVLLLAGQSVYAASGMNKAHVVNNQKCRE